MSEVKITNIIGEAEDTIVLVLERPEGFDYEAGQYTTVTVEINGEIYKRSYSFCSSPLDTNELRIAVRLVTDGIVSNYLILDTLVGDTLTLSKPKGRFREHYEPDSQEEYVLFAGGIGIVPIFSIIRTVLYGQPLSKVKLVYANRSEKTMVFRSELKELEEEFPDRLEVVHILSQPSNSWSGLKGRLNFNLIAQHIDRDADQEYFLCAPQKLMELIEKVLRSRAIPKDKIHTELFIDSKKASIKKRADFKDELVDRSVEVEYDGYIYEVPVPKGTCILQACIDVGLDFMSFDCQDGYCTSCRAIVQTGKILEQTENPLSTKYKNEGYKLLCQSFPDSDDVYIKL